MYRSVLFVVLTIGAIIVLALVMMYFLGDFIAGVVCAFLVNIIVGLYFFCDQFVWSTAGYRVKKTAEATLKIINQGSGCSRERDRYRYSLGDIIDELAQTFGKNGNFESKEWPCLVDYDSTTHQILKKDEKSNDIDRWKRFERVIRPVVDDINSSSFIGSYRWMRFFSKDICQLYALTKLCNQLETVVSELDAAFEAKSLIRLNDKNHVVLQEITNQTDSQTESIKQRLGNEYCALFEVWREWLYATGILCKSA